MHVNCLSFPHCNMKRVVLDPQTTAIHRALLVTKIGTRIVEGLNSFRPKAVFTIVAHRLILSTKQVQFVIVLVRIKRLNSFITRLLTHL